MPDVTDRPPHQLPRRAVRIALAGAVLATSGLLAACSGRADGGNGGPVPEPSETTVNTVPPGGG